MISNIMSYDFNVYKAGDLDPPRSAGPAGEAPQVRLRIQRGSKRLFSSFLLLFEGCLKKSRRDDTFRPPPPPPPPAWAVAT